MASMASMHSGPWWRLSNEEFYAQLLGAPQSPSSPLEPCSNAEYYSRLLDPTSSTTSSSSRNRQQHHLRENRQIDSQVRLDRARLGRSPGKTPTTSEIKTTTTPTSSSSGAPSSTSSGKNVLVLLADRMPTLMCSVVAPFLKPEATARLSMTCKIVLEALAGCDLRFDRVEKEERTASTQFLKWLARSSVPASLPVPVPAIASASSAAITTTAMPVSASAWTSPAPTTTPAAQAKTSIMQSIRNFSFFKLKKLSSSPESTKNDEVLKPLSRTTPTRTWTSWRVTGIHISTLEEWNQCSSNPELQKSVEFVTMDGKLVHALNGAMPDVSTFARLGSVELLGWANLTSLEVLARSAKHMHTLKIDWAKDLVDITAISLCKKLETFEINWCPSLTSIEPLGACVRLTSLSIGGCGAQISSISDLKDCFKLNKLNIRGLKELTSIGALENLTHIRELDASHCPKLANIAPISCLGELQILDLSDNQFIKNLDPLRGLRALRKLTLSSCRSLSDISALEGLDHLEFLILSACPELNDLSCISSLSRLRELSLRSCVSLINVSPLAKCAQLRTLDLSDCTGLVDISPLGSDLTSLQHLLLSGCSVHDPSSISKCPKLNRIELARCQKLQDISFLVPCPSLQVLVVDEKFRDLNAEIRIALPELEVIFSSR